MLSRCDSVKLIKIVRFFKIYIFFMFIICAYVYMFSSSLVHLNYPSEIQFNYPSCSKASVDMPKINYLYKQKKALAYVSQLN